MCAHRAKLVAKQRSDFEARVDRAGLAGRGASDDEAARLVAEVVTAMVRLEAHLGGVK